MSADLLNEDTNVVGFPPKVPPRLTSMSAAKNTATFQKHHYSTQPGHSYQPPTTKPPPSPVSKHQEKIAGRAIPPVVKPKPLGYRTYDSLNDDEEQFPLPVPPRKGLETPPPLPSQPIPHLTPRQKSLTAEGTKSATKHSHSPVSVLPVSKSSPAPDDDGTLTLVDFVKNYSHSLPLKVQVEEGFCGSEERFIISTGDIYNFHFIKNEKVISVKDAGGTHFSIPLNSAIQFGLLYNPVGDTAQAVKGYSFKTVGDLAKYETPPRIIRATQAFDVSDSKSSIEAEEILIIKKVGRTAIKRKHYIKVISLHSRDEKTLYEDCEGCFLTDPGSVRLYLTDIVEFFGDCLPLKAMLFLNSDVTDDSVSHLVSEVITLTHISVMTSIIATTCWNEDDSSATIPDIDDEDEVPIAIPIELEISVKILEAQSEDERLYHSTKELFDNFDPCKIRTISGPSSTAHASRALKRSVRVGYEHQGLEILRPSKVYDECEFGPNSDDAQEGGPQDQKSCIATTHQQLAAVLQRKPAENLSPRVDQLPYKTHHPALKSTTISSPKRSSSEQYTSDPCLTSTLPALPPVPQHDSPSSNQHSAPLPMFTYGNLNTPDSGAGSELDDRGQLDHLKSELIRAFSIIDDLTCKYNSIENQISQLKRAMSVSGDAMTDNPYSTQAERNVEELRCLDNKQVLDLLEKMNLSQYSEVFINEQIDGEVLAQCDENILQHELSICATIHRVRLMKVITGKYSATLILEGQGPYGVVHNQ